LLNQSQTGQLLHQNMHIFSSGRIEKLTNHRWIKSRIGTKSTL